MAGGACVTGGACVAGGACMVGGVCMARGRAWQRRACVAKGGMHGKRGVCMAKGAACVVCMPRWVGYYEIRSVNARAVHILLECILV